MASTAPTPCPEKQRLLDEYKAAVDELVHYTNAQLDGLVGKHTVMFDAEIERANVRQEAAKRAIIAHRQEHGC